MSPSGPTCAECDELAAAVIHGRPLCGAHSLEALGRRPQGASDEEVAEALENVSG